VTPTFYCIGGGKSVIDTRSNSCWCNNVDDDDDDELRRQQHFHMNRTTNIVINIMPIYTHVRPNGVNCDKKVLLLLVVIASLPLVVLFAFVGGSLPLLIFLSDDSDAVVAVNDAATNR
jgi:hypothetical protein